ncbi:MAG: pyridoxamine 5'-phosphate oxidase family protein [Chloroflexi bacterium]|jgi:nitroimidazol reductase NimA-like FMN-containing flavoprotein (pyridoxamine 5'-phosphate oxidase superfamily)|nr:pyridoxamine 5'-phosphate oxidase family protein [Anaerolineaceae bacterium]NMD27963.1 pyridoxamine 5'-phosphate oxidase family protein [Chloroflexota bacterium]
MFRPMRRKAQQLSEAEALDILEKGSSGVLAAAGDEDYPYAVPLSYAYCEGRLYFHVARSGHKLDAIARNDKVSFCVIQKDEVVPAEFTTYYRSVVVFGRARILTDEAEKRRALRLLVQKYSPGFLAEGESEITRAWERFHALELRIENMTGKAAKELMLKQ